MAQHLTASTTIMGQKFARPQGALLTGMQKINPFGPQQGRVGVPRAMKNPQLKTITRRITHGHIASKKVKGFLRSFRAWHDIIFWPPNRPRRLPANARSEDPWPFLVVHICPHHQVAVHCMGPYHCNWFCRVIFCCFSLRGSKYIVCGAVATCAMCTQGLRLVFFLLAYIIRARVSFTFCGSALVW